MEDDRVLRLSEGQRTCLRLVLQHMTSKDMARVLGISPHTADQRLKAAMQTLGAPSRVEAARILARAEGGGHQPLVYQPPELAAAQARGPVRYPADAGGADGLAATLREEQAPYRYAQSFPPDAAASAPAARGARNDLDLLQRLGWIAGITIGAALAFGALIAGLEALTRML